MKLKIFSVYDSKAGFWEKPFVMRSRGEALRGWQIEANKDDTSIGKFPTDFCLFEIGDYCQDSGAIVPYETKQSLGLAVEYKKVNDMPVEKPVTLVNNL